MRIRLQNSRCIARGLLRCNESIAGIVYDRRTRYTGESGTTAGLFWRGVVVTPVVVFGRLDDCSFLNYRLRKRMVRVRNDLELAANTQASGLSPRSARITYNKVTWSLEQCNDTDTSFRSFVLQGSLGESKSVTAWAERYGAITAVA